MPGSRWKASTSRAIGDAPPERARKAFTGSGPALPRPLEGGAGGGARRGDVPRVREFSPQDDTDLRRVAERLRHGRRQRLQHLSAVLVTGLVDLLRKRKPA